MQSTTKKRMAWVSDSITWKAHEAHVKNGATCDWYPDVAHLLKAVCNQQYDAVIVQSHLLPRSTISQADLGSVIKTMCGIHHDASPHVVILINAQTDQNWLKISQSEGYLGMLPDVTWQPVKEFSEALEHVIQGTPYWPKRMWTWHVPHKQVSVKSAFKLTPRQTQVLQMIQTRGSSNKVIAKQLKISESTVKVHIGAIMKKFGVRNRTQLAVSALQQKL
jgi:DNA-binding NarL/FixJ family response regulator